jgi:sortase A
MRRAAGLVLIGLGALVFAWLAVTLRFGDPITTIQTNHEQGKLRQELDQLNRGWQPTAPAARPKPAASRPARSTMSAAAEVAGPGAKRTPAAPRSSAARATRVVEWTESGVKRWATQFRAQLREGHAVGRIVVPELNLRMVVVSGTTKKDLKKGPGLYNIRRKGYATSLPGMGGVVAIAGHRTTYAHPFRHIDTLHAGDRVYIEMPYGRFTYRIYRSRVVSASNWEILRKPGFEKLVLSACNPLHSLRQRWVVFARLIRTQPPAALRRA